jgi:hypothetical protein
MQEVRPPIELGPKNIVSVVLLHMAYNVVVISWT